MIFLENEILYGRSFDVPILEDYTVPFGKAKIWREGSDVTIVSFGIGMTYALEAAERLEKDGINAEVIDLRTLRPLDYDTVIASVMKTNRCVTVEEGVPVGSSEGKDVGNSVGSPVGSNEGSAVGSSVGSAVGSMVGSADGAIEGNGDGWLRSINTRFTVGKSTVCVRNGLDMR